MTAILEVDRVDKFFGGVAANRAVSLRVERGEIVGLIGPNGSGKTTLFNAIVGQHPIDGGSIRFQGREISRLNVPAIARLGLLRTFQQTRVYRGMSCLDNMLISTAQAGLGFGAMLAGMPAEVRERAEEILGFIGLHAKRRLKAGDLSYGQQKLLELGMALMSDPKLLLLDEPTAGINPTLINGLVDRLRRVNERQGIALLIIEHNMRVIMTLAGRLYCLAHGEMLAEGSPVQMRNDPRVIDAYLGAS